MNFADHVIKSVIEKKSYSVVGLDPNLEYVPDFLKQKNLNKYGNKVRAAAESIFEFNKAIIDNVYDLVPAVKIQSAYYEVLGSVGIEIFQRTAQYAKQKQLLVIGDVKRNDISSTAAQYSKAYLKDGNEQFEGVGRIFDTDAITVNPYLGSDGILPFVQDCQNYGRGVFILVKTSNKSSSEIQHLLCEDGRYIYEIVAEYVNKWGKNLIGKYGYSSIGAVVGATFPKQACSIRRIIKNAIFLVPGFGFQGANACNIVNMFNEDGLGAIINSSRGIIFSYIHKKCDQREFAYAAREAVIHMNTNINQILIKHKKIAW